MARGMILVGCGKMGSALLAGWMERDIALDDITIVEPTPEIADDLKLRLNIKVVASPDAIADDADPEVIVFAVKPQTMDDVVPAYRHFASAIFLSIAAGKAIRYFEEKLGAGRPIVRSMPNTPAAVRRSMTVACPNPHVTADQRRLCHDLLEAAGEVSWVEDESQLDAVTAVSGSGPAYVFLLAECMAAAGVAAGLPEDLAERLAQTTIAGSGELLRRSRETAGELRQNVTSPGGTTAAALEVLMAENGMPTLMHAAIVAATKRSQELAD